jgi:formylglycine-generating enzyme required for sulfatase activity
VVIPLILVVALVAVFFTIRANALSTLVVPNEDTLLVRTFPDESAPLMARIGAGQAVEIIGRSDDWRWLEVKIWGGDRGWALRPLDILVWQIDAPETPPDNSPETLSQPVTPVAVEMVAIPATTFTMGSPPGIGKDDERPAHAVSISAFEIDRTEVTLGQYWECVINGPCAAPISDASQGESHYLSDPAFDNHPVTNVSWSEANRYCLRQGKRLPTEAEWELAASWNLEKNAKFQWPWGSDPDAGQANVGPTSLDQPAVVDSLATDVSPTGVMGMAGNVSEWVFDWYKVDYYSIADDTDPVGPTHRRGEGTGRVIRGGSFASTLEEARTTSRQHREEEYGYPTVGFRCVRDG